MGSQRVARFFPLLSEPPHKDGLQNSVLVVNLLFSGPALLSLDFSLNCGRDGYHSSGLTVPVRRTQESFPEILVEDPVGHMSCVLILG